MSSRRTLLESESLADALQQLQQRIGRKGCPASMRSLSRALGISTPGFFQEAVSGKRTLTEEHIERLGELFLLTALEIRYFVTLWKAESAHPETAADARRRLMALRARARGDRPLASAPSQRLHLLNDWQEHLDDYSSAEVTTISLAARCAPEALCHYNDMLTTLAWEMRGRSAASPESPSARRKHRVVLASMPMAKSTVTGAPLPSEALTPVDSYHSYRRLLAERLEWLRKRNPRFSFRRVAHILRESDPGFAQKVLAGKRNLTEEQALKLALLFGFGDAETRYFRALVKLESHEEPADDAMTLTRLRGEGLLTSGSEGVFSSWMVLVVHILSSLPDFQDTPDWVASALRGLVLPSEAEFGLAEARRHGILAQQGEGTRPVGTLIGKACPDAVNPLHGGALTTLARGLSLGTPMQWEDFPLALSAGDFAGIKEAARQVGRDITYLAMKPEYLKESLMVQIGIYVFPETQR